MIDGEPPTPDEPPTPAARPRLWNPNAAANWSLLLTPIFGACLHAANWRALGQPERAAKNVAWVWVEVGFIVIVILSCSLPESAALDKGLQFVGFGLLLAWYFGQGRPQVRYVRETHGDDYDRRGWVVPLLCGVVGWVAYFGLVMAASTALAVLRPVTAAGLAEQVRPLILTEWHKDPAARDARIESLTLAHQGGNNYAGTVDATVGGRPQKYTLTVTHSRAMMEWRIHPVPPDLGTLVAIGTHRLYFTPGVTAAEAKRLGDYLTKSGFFAGENKAVQLAKSGATYQVRTPVTDGFDRLPDTAETARWFAAELSEAVFDSAPTELHLCDGRFVTLRVVTMH